MIRPFTQPGRSNCSGFRPLPAGDAWSLTKRCFTVAVFISALLILLVWLAGCEVAGVMERYPATGLTTQPAKASAEFRWIAGWSFMKDLSVGRMKLKTPEGGSLDLSGVKSTVDVEAVKELKDVLGK